MKESANGRGLWIFTHVMDERETRRSGEHKAAPPVAPAETADHRRQKEAHEEDELDIPTVLPPDDLILAQIADVDDAELAAWWEPAALQRAKELVGRLLVRDPAKRVVEVW